MTEVAESIRWIHRAWPFAAVLLHGCLAIAATVQPGAYAIQSLNTPYPEFVDGDSVKVQVHAPAPGAIRGMLVRLNGSDSTFSLKPDTGTNVMTGNITGLRAGRNLVEVFAKKSDAQPVARLTVSTAIAPKLQCADLVGIAIPAGALGSPSDKVVIASAQLGAATPMLPAHCIVRGSANPHDGAGNSHFAIGFEVRLPDRWSGRFLFQGGGGNDGAVSPATGANTGSGSPPALAHGFAVAATDGGHAGRPAESFGFDQQARIDHAYNAYDKTTVIARAIMRLYYGQDPDTSYVIGCSGGGRHAMMFSQRFPAYFDGVVACSPAMRVSSGATISAAWESKLYQAIAPVTAAGPVLSQAFSNDDLQLLSRAILGACDARDGAEDGAIDDYQDCTFEPKALLCPGAKLPSCLSAAQVNALAQGFGGPRNTAGTALYSRWPWDAGVSSPGWRSWKIGSSPDNRPNSAFVSLMQDAMDNEFFTPPDPKFSIFDFNFDRDPGRMEAESAIYDTYRDDKLTAFHNRGGKILFIHGLSDPIFSPLDTMDYYNRLARNNGGISAVQAWARAFFVPGMNHCSGGPATDTFDGLSAIIAWVENNQAPDRIVATGKAFPGRSRPLCAYPAQTHYSGSGNVESADSFVCR